LDRPKARALRVGKAALFGIGGGIAGGAVYTAVLAALNINAALITILIGWLVGKGVHKGSDGRGGRGYQILAVVITYMSIGSFAFLSEVFGEGAGKFSILEAIFFCAMGAIVGPVTMATSSLLSGLITFFGLMQAWRQNGQTQVSITGPHALAPTYGPGARVVPETVPPPVGQARTSPESPSAPSA
jgi:hypothetical protein